MGTGEGPETQQNVISMGTGLGVVKSFMVAPPKRRFAQHFLKDAAVLERINRYLQPASGEVFLEVGAGRGALSERLAPTVDRLIAVEVDSDCLNVLESVLASHPSARIIHGDILKLDLESCLAPFLHAGRKLRVAGNLPYNIATAIIEKLLESSLSIQDMTFLVQWEVARRIVSPPGSREYGFLSVFCQHRCEVRMGFKVMPGSFAPRPKVISALVRLLPMETHHSAAWESAFLNLVKAAFRHRRKTLANSLRLDPELGDRCGLLLAQAGINGSRRAEDLSVAEFENLAHHLQSQ